MTDQLRVVERPCPTCPYRRDHPSGVWTAEEYRKLPQYDVDPADLEPGDPLPLAAFLCHYSAVRDVDTVCRGWLVTHPDSLAVRFAMVRGALEQLDVDRPCDVELFASGAEACENGLRDVDEPGPRAVEMVRSLIRRGMG